MLIRSVNPEWWTGFARMIESTLPHQLLGVAFALLTAMTWTSGEQSVQALQGCIPTFQLNTLRLIRE